MNVFLRVAKITGRLIAVVLVIFIILCILFDYEVTFRISDRDLLQYFADHRIKGEVRYYEAEGRRVRYAAVGNDSLPVILFIHGAPSSLSIYKDYFADSAFEQKFRMYAVDRPGYGNSGLGVPEPSIEKQAKIISAILRKSNTLHRPVIVVAASYGTSVACRLVMDNPGLVDGLVLTGPSLAPGQEKTYWFSPYIETPLLNWGVPRMLRSANREKMHHREELTKMLPLWKNIRIPVMYMQGAKDQLIDTTNASFARAHLVNAPYLNIHFFPGRPHFIPFTEHVAIRAHILAMLDMLENKAVPDYPNEVKK